MKALLPFVLVGLVAVQIWVVAFLADLQAATRRLLADQRARDRERTIAPTAS